MCVACAALSSCGHSAAAAFENTYLVSPPRPHRPPPTRPPHPPAATPTHAPHRLPPALPDLLTHPCLHARCAAIMQLHPGWVGVLQRQYLNSLGCLWFNRTQASGAV